MTEKMLVVASALSLLLSQAPCAFSAQTGLGSTQGGMRRVVDGIASFYADQFHGRRTASGETFNMNAMTCAHKYLPFGTKLLVKNSTNGKTVTVTVNDRGPYWGNRVLDLSREAARRLGISGTSHVVCYTNKLGKGGYQKSPEQNPSIIAAKPPVKQKAPAMFIASKPVVKAPAKHNVPSDAIASKPQAKPANKHAIASDAIATLPAVKHAFKPAQANQIAMQPAVKHVVLTNAIASLPASKPAVKHVVQTDAIASLPTSKPAAKHVVPTDAVASLPASKPVVKPAVPANAIASQPASKPVVKLAVPANAIASLPASKPVVKPAVPANAIASQPASKPVVKPAVPTNAIASQPASKPVAKPAVPANAIAMNKTAVKLNHADSNLIAMMPPPPIAAATRLETSPMPIASSSLRPQLQGSVAENVSSSRSTMTSSSMSRYISRQSRIEIRRQRTTTVAMDNGVVTITSIESSSSN